MYDYIIVGSGVAGAVCAYELSRIGYSCLAIEKNAKDYEKICGGVESAITLAENEKSKLRTY